MTPSGALRPRRSRGLGGALCVLAALACTASARAEQAASDVRSLQAGLLDAGDRHSCAVLAGGVLRCWGDGAFGRLGYGNVDFIGDNETPGSVGPVNLGAGRTARAVAAGDEHTCAVLDDGTVRCWGRNNFGQLGYGNIDDIGDNETPDTAGPVNLGADRTASAITAGAAHTCVIMDDGNVRCWGLSTDGRLGYGNGVAATENIGDDEAPGIEPVVNLAQPARAITAGNGHTCALLDNGKVSCWGRAAAGALGYGNTNSIGITEDPRDAGSVNLGAGRTARAIAAFGFSTCAILDNDAVRCWGAADFGQLGYGTTTFGGTNFLGDNETPDTAGPVNLGAGRTARAIAGGGATCAIMDNDAVRCWGTPGNIGLLGYGNQIAIGDNETPDSAGPVDLGVGRTARAITAGGKNTCAVLDDGTVRCWGDGGFPGYGNTDTIGDNETPGTVGPAQLGGAVTTAMGDAAVTLTADAPSRQVGQEVRLTTTLSSAGPDPVSGAAVTSVLPAGLQLVSAMPSAGSFAGATWSVASLAPGQAVTLSVVARVVAAGTQTASAELTALAPFFADVDSTPDNHAATEDDQASVTVIATAAPPGGSGCPVEATFASVRCRLGDLLTAVQQGVPAGRLATRLDALVGAAASAVDAAEQHAADGKTRLRKKALARARRALGRLVKKLRSKRATSLDAAVRTALVAATDGLRADLATLRAP